ncbi:MAG: triose-phosphate isomerase [Cyanobacteria bacterium P01_D01_bin.123]
MRHIAIAGNWKMHKTQAETREFLQQFLPHTAKTEGDRYVILAVPFTDLAAAVAEVKGTRVAIAAQNVHGKDTGAFTGEISAPMLKELGVEYVVIGHSERREYFGETDATVNQRLLAAQKHGLKPILCVGESKATRDAAQAEAWILRQLDEDLVGVDLSELIIAYEPIWAIGTGDTCEACEANRIIGIIRNHLSTPDVSIQYGGSVKPANIDEIMAQAEIDGVLVGGASLDADGFGRIVNYQVPVEMASN